MRRDQRMSRKRDFGQLSAGGKQTSARHLSVRVGANGLDHNRFAFAIGRRVGKAVVRNRVRRRLRAILSGLILPGGHDILVSARASAVPLNYHDLEAEVIGLLRRARLRPGVAPIVRQAGEAVTPERPVAHPPPSDH